MKYNRQHLLGQLPSQNLNYLNTCDISKCLSQLVGTGRNFKFTGKWKGHKGSCTMHIAWLHQPHFWGYSFAELKHSHNRVKQTTWDLEHAAMWHHLVHHICAVDTEENRGFVSDLHPLRSLWCPKAHSDSYLPKVKMQYPTGCAEVAGQENHMSHIHKQYRKMTSSSKCQTCVSFPPKGSATRGACSLGSTPELASWWPWYSPSALYDFLPHFYLKRKEGHL